MSENLITNWPFDQTPKTAVLTTKRIRKNGYPILLVTHDEDDHGWQFLDGYDADPDMAMIVAFHRIVESDPSLLALVDLPPGWRAWRENSNDSWHKGKIV